MTVSKRINKDNCQISWEMSFNSWSLGLFTVFELSKILVAFFKRKSNLSVNTRKYPNRALYSPLFHAWVAPWLSSVLRLLSIISHMLCILLRNFPHHFSFVAFVDINREFLSFLWMYLENGFYHFAIFSGPGTRAPGRERACDLCLSIEDFNVLQTGSVLAGTFYQSYYRSERRKMF